MAEGRQRPTSSILAAIAQGRAVRLMMVGAHVTVRRRGSLCRVHGSIVDETRNAEDRRELPGRVGGSPEVPGVVTCAQGRRRFWHSAVFGERPEGG
jgi:hypothetical protein